ncbi:hypothetical protein LWE61_15185 [Sphingobium sufflavum]|uniref:hypothetical protein n=1 Tax=Sphingobium sufflavum TaxID=1129547 RepID=UPI001F46217E|nr:hypothetical protein [Sphingobium sufflavum]MCE7797893.1 hypothetical protein [Sphingobium sufflavum]
MSGNFDPHMHVPGVWRCAKCSFTLYQANLNAQDGTVTARDEAGDNCPNDGAPLWRVTWKDYATEQVAMAEDCINRKSAEIERLKHALAPFAEVAEDIPCAVTDAGIYSVDLPAGSFRLAHHVVGGVIAGRPDSLDVGNYDAADLSMLTPAELTGFTDDAE